MNSDMNPDIDGIYQNLLNWLLTPTSASPNPELFDEGAIAQAELNSDSLTEEEIQFCLQSLSDEQKPPLSQPLTAMNELTNLEYRFQSILKQRLQNEIERHPPLFPWESDINDYESDYLEELPETNIPWMQLWTPQLAGLNIAFSLPTKIAQELLTACSEAMQSLQPQGAKLVKAVSELFPDEQQSLNQMAGWVLLAPSRSATATISADYGSANRQQQMAMSLLAANEILKQLTIQISASEPAATREWQTTAGLVTLKAEYLKNDHQTPVIRLETYLPQGGSLSWDSPQGSVEAQRTYRGHLNIEIPDVQVGETYTLRLHLGNVSQVPLNFAIVVS